MDRVRRLVQLWSWLPAFRAVAETEHLPTASERLFLTPSALSRSIRLLEEDLGMPLFERVGRRLVLNAAGQELLSGVRDAMRRIDDAITAMSGGEPSGPFRVAAPLPFHSIVVLPALTDLQTRSPGLVPHLVSLGASAANAALLAGELDLAVLDDPVRDPHLEIERLARISYGVYCGPTHPLYDHPRPTLEDLRPHPFAAPPDDGDHWPPDLPRIVGTVLSHLQLGIELCAAGRYLAVLPDLLAVNHPAAAGTRRLPIEVFGETALYAVYRESLGVATVTDLVMTAIREHARTLQLQVDSRPDAPARPATSGDLPIGNG